MYYRQVLKFGKSPFRENKKNGAVYNCPVVRDDPDLRAEPAVQDIGRSTAPRTKHGVPGEQIRAKR